MPGLRNSLPCHLGQWIDRAHCHGSRRGQVPLGVRQQSRCCPYPQCCMNLCHLFGGHTGPWWLPSIRSTGAQKEGGR